MTNHTITMADTALGGIFREYIEHNGELAATNVVHIDGDRYEMVERQAEVGEKVIMTRQYRTYRLAKGAVYNVIDDGISATEVRAADNSVWAISHGHYRVLVPLASDEPSDDFDAALTEADIRNCPAKVIDMLASLSQRVVELERSLSDLGDANERAYKRVAERVEESAKNIETLAQELEGVKRKVPKSGAELLSDAFASLAKYERSVGR